MTKEVVFKVIGKTDEAIWIKVDGQQIADGTLMIKCHGRIGFPIASTKEVGDVVVCQFEV